MLSMRKFLWYFVLCKDDFLCYQVAMGFIILGQTQFLRFEIEDKSASVGACFVTAFLELVIVVAIWLYQKRSAKSSISRENYIDLGSERDIRPR